MKIGDLYRVNTADSHRTSHYGDVVVVQAWSESDFGFSYLLVRGYNLNKQSVHDYFYYELTKVNK